MMFVATGPRGASGGGMAWAVGAAAGAGIASPGGAGATAAAGGVASFAAGGAASFAVGGTLVRGGRRRGRDRWRGFDLHGRRRLARRQRDLVERPAPSPRG